MTAPKTCDHILNQDDSRAPRWICGAPAEWLVTFSNDGRYSTDHRCDAHLVDAQDDDDYVGAHAL